MMTMDKEYDIIVAGGGTAGVASAVTAAREGASVLLIERYGFLGGMGTAGLVSPFMSCYAAMKEPINEFSDISKRKILNKGIFEEVVNRLEKKNGILKFVDVTAFDNEALKAVLADMVAESGVKLLYHSYLFDVCKEQGSITGVQVINKSGRAIYRAKAFIDCTGDADLAFFAGEHCELGDKADKKCQPGTLMFKLANVDLFVPRGSVEYPLPEEAGIPCGRVLFFMTPHRGEILVNMTRIIDFNATDAENLSNSELESRKQIDCIVTYLRNHVKGFENAYVSQTGTQIGIRESRRVMGKYVLTQDDVLSCRKFSDGISRTAYPVDIHNPSGQGTIIRKLPEGEWYEIPFRCLQPLSVENLLVAGKCISSTHEAQASMRIMPNCFCMGEAAGLGAALAVRRGISVSRINGEEIAGILKERGIL